MEFATIQDAIDKGFKVIHERESDGQRQQVILIHEEQWSIGNPVYLIVELSDDGYVVDTIGLVNGKVMTL